VRREYGVVDSPVLQAYIQTMGRRLVRVSHRPTLAGFIEYQNRIVQIVGITPDVQRFGDLIEQSIRSFDRVTDDRILRAQPDRLKIYTAQEGDTLTRLAERIDNPRVTADDLAVLNRLAIDQPMMAGRLIKIVEKGY